MVRKIALLTIGLTIFLPCSCAGTDTTNECSKNSVEVFTIYVESNETANHEIIDATINENINGATIATPEVVEEYQELTIAIPEAVEEYQEPNYPQDEQSDIDPICIWNFCTGCEKLYIDGEYIQLCDIRQKYEFFFSTYIMDGWDGQIVDNWWRPEDTKPATSQSFSSDATAGYFVFENDRIVIHDTGGRIRIDGFFESSLPNRIVELTTTQWDEWGVQIFQYAGDVTLISMQGVLSQFPELQEETFDYYLDFCEERTAGREILYIYYHELPESRLWNLLMDNSTFDDE